MLHLRFASTDPAMNLALEEALFNALEEGQPGWLLLWQNAPSIIVGRHQNTAEEIDCARVEAKGIPVVRRMTGGGAVYHDLGNLNFSFLAFRKQAGRIDFSAWLKPVAQALSGLGAEVAVTGRNDLEIAGRKISGSAQRLQNGRGLHHGTLLVHPDFDAMSAFLHPDQAKYASKGVASVRARVTCLADQLGRAVAVDEVCRLLAEACADGEGALPEGVLAEARRLASEKYQSWDWNFGASPKYTERRSRRFAWGRVEVFYDVAKGRIASARVMGDFFAARDPEEFGEALKGQPRRPEDLLRHLKTLPLGQWFAGCSEAELAAFLAEL